MASLKPIVEPSNSSGNSSILTGQAGSTMSSFHGTLKEEICRYYQLCRLEIDDNKNIVEYDSKTDERCEKRNAIIEKVKKMKEKAITEYNDEV